MLKRLTIKGLFDRYDYDFDFAEPKDLHIRFITGPNGYGKTTILELIVSLLSQDWDFLTLTPYSSLEYIFNNGRISINRTVKMPEDDKSDLSEPSEIRLKVEYRNAEDELQTEFNRLYKNYDIHDSFSGKFKGEMKHYLSEQPKYYIRENRKHSIYDNNNNLLIEDADVTADNNKDFVNQLTKYADHIKDVLNNVAVDNTGTYSKQEYDKDASQLKWFVDRLIHYDLINIRLPKYDEKDSQKVKSIMCAFISLEKELEDYIKRLDLFCQLIAKCRFTAKQLIVNKTQGCVFITDETEIPLDVDMLSSGEQHVLILFYEMLFKAERGTILLIDEPEMSFHMAWQIHFQENLQQIVNSRNLQCIIATHSPQIFNRKWDTCYDLYRLTHPQIMK